MKSITCFQQKALHNGHKIKYIKLLDNELSFSKLYNFQNHLTNNLSFKSQLFSFKISPKIMIPDFNS